MESTETEQNGETMKTDESDQNGGMETAETEEHRETIETEQCEARGGLDMDDASEGNFDERQDEEVTDADPKSDSNTEIKTNESHQFAVPSLPAMTKNDCKKNDQDRNTDRDRPTENSKGKINVKKLAPKKLPKEKIGKFPYTPPPWGGAPSSDKKYSLTVLKEGTVLDTIDLSGKSTLTFGRHPTACDVLVEHPSCSRYHAALQFCVEEKEVRKVGYYLYDMGSTHGCYVNKERMRPKVYVRVRVGYQIKFGGSSRRYIMEGPEEDQEDEGDIEEVRKVQEMRKQAKKSKENTTKPSGDVDGASWGFGEDAEEEELDLKALMENKKTIEVKDPKKTLKGFFEREGLDFEYEMSERGRGNSVVHVAQVHLPIESSLGNEIIAEGTSSNKKDAVLNCAIDACKIIQAYDMMQNPLREGEREKRQRQLEENDFYDSDDDNFLDRTGSIEKKRLKRKQFAGKKEKVEVSTHESLKTELSEKVKQLATLEQKLQLSMEGEDQDDGDSLDAFMSNIANKLDKKEKSQLKRQIVEMKKDIDRVEKLVERTQPALPTFTIKENEEEADEKSVLPKVETTTKISNAGHTKSSNVSNVSKKLPTVTKQFKNKEVIPPDKKRKVVSGPSLKPPTNERDTIEQEKEKEVTEWEPPKGQTGDGRTHLNDKFGY